MSSDLQEYLNNCSYPHGICYTKTGKCKCRMGLNPNNNRIPWHLWGGEDCSYISVLANAPGVKLGGYASFNYAATAARALAVTMV